MLITFLLNLNSAIFVTHIDIFSEKFFEVTLQFALFAN
jgi:hypothetical protein